MLESLDPLLNEIQKRLEAKVVHYGYTFQVEVAAHERRNLDDFDLIPVAPLTPGFKVHQFLRVL